MSRLSKEDWLKKGLAVLSLKGEDSIRVELLCKELKVSKGSFYHHFTNADTYIVELMKFWELENTVKIIADTERAGSIKGKVDKLNENAGERDHLAEVRIRAWAVRNSVVESYVRKVDKLRLDYLAKLHQEAGRDMKTADYLAKIEYAAFVGMQHLFRDLPLRERKTISETFNQLLNLK